MPKILAKIFKVTLFNDTLWFFFADKADLPREGKTTTINRFFVTLPIP